MTNPQTGKHSKTKPPPQTEPLLVKELAVALGVSPRFIYQMRARGFLMDGDSCYRQTATAEEARSWIKANHFRLINGVGVIDRHRKIVLDSGTAAKTMTRFEPTPARLGLRPTP